MGIYIVKGFIFTVQMLAVGTAVKFLIVAMGGMEKITEVLP